MITLDNVHKAYRTRSGTRTVVEGVNLRIHPGEKVGILGRNGAGKSTLIRLLSGAERPSSGSIRRAMSVSWPLAFTGAFQGSLTGIDNLRFICRVYGVDPTSKMDFVSDFAELGRYLREPVKSYSSGMRARLSFAISMAIEFDCYLIDEVTAVGDARFHLKCEDELFGRRGDRAMIMVSHSPEMVRQHCSTCCVLHDGHLSRFDSVSLAYEHYGALT